MPELPEAERARALIAERALGREIAAVEDSDTLRVPARTRPVSSLPRSSGGA